MGSRCLTFLFSSLPFKGLTFYPVAAVAIAIPEAAEPEGSTLPLTLFFANRAYTFFQSELRAFLLKMKSYERGGW